MNAAQYLLVCVWNLGDMRLVWAFGIENRQSTTVLPCLQSAFEDLRSLTGGSSPPVLRLHSDKAKEFLSPLIMAYLSRQGVRQTMNSGIILREMDSLKVGWKFGIIKVRATALLMPADGLLMSILVESLRLPLTKTFRILDVMVHQALKKPPSFENRGTTRVCLGHDSRVSGGVIVCTRRSNNS